MEADIWGRAIADFQLGSSAGSIITYMYSGKHGSIVADMIPVPYLFREYPAMPALEQRALDECRGQVLDVGCGAGSHSLYLQQKGLRVTALDQSEGAVATCRRRGIKHVVNSDVYHYGGTNFDTLLLLMNGLGIAGRMGHLNRFLRKLRSLVKPGGQILLDSCDIAYFFDDEIRQDCNYYGEVQFKLEYKGQRGKKFHWLYLDFDALKSACIDAGLTCHLLSKGKNSDYLARLCAN